MIQSRLRRKEVSYSNGFNPIRCRLIKTEDTGWLSFEISIYVINPLLPVTAIGLERSLFVIGFEKSHLIVDRLPKLIQNSLLLSLQDSCHFSRLRFAPSLKGSVGSVSCRFPTFLKKCDELPDIVANRLQQLISDDR
jgi:hypothetical protein